MSLKPFDEISSDKELIKEKKRRKPFIDVAHGGIEVKENDIENDLYKKQSNIFKKSINYLGSFSTLFAILVIFIIFILINDAIWTIKSLYLSHSVMDTTYLIILLILMLSLTFISYKNYMQIKTLKNAKKMQDFFTKQKTNPTKDIVGKALKLTDKYISNKDDSIKQKALFVKEKINNSHDYREIYKDLDEELLSLIDTQAKKKILNASTQSAISTAISPLALLDAVIVIWRSFLLTKEIASLYGFKPDFLLTLILLKRGTFNVMFAGVAELASEYISEATHSSIISKISLSAGQGLSNGVLIARLGFGVIQACRPITSKTKRETFVKSIFISLIKQLS